MPDVIIEDVYTRIDNYYRRLFCIYDLRNPELFPDGLKYKPAFVIDAGKPMWNDRLIRAVELLDVADDDIQKAAPRVISNALFKTYLDLAR